MREWVFVISFLSFIVFFAITSWNYPYISILYPRIIMVIGAILGVAKIVMLLRKRKEDKTEEEERIEEDYVDQKKMWMYLACGILCIVIMPYLGFALTSIITLGILFTLLGLNLRTIGIISIGTTLALYVIFVLLLKIPLPKGILLGLL